MQVSCSKAPSAPSKQVPNLTWYPSKEEGDQSGLRKITQDVAQLVFHLIKGKTFCAKKKPRIWSRVESCDVRSQSYDF
jgi:hypothetical protein